MVERIRIPREPLPHVLPTELWIDFDQLRRMVRKALNPQNYIEQTYADEFAHEVWHGQRYRRSLSLCIKKHMGNALFDMLCELDACKRDHAAQLVDRWCRDDASAKTEVFATLRKHGKNEHDVEADAMCRCLGNVDLLEQLLTSAGLRRDKALVMIPFVREMMTKQNQPAATDAVAKDSVVRLARFKGKAG